MNPPADFRPLSRPCAIVPTTYIPGVSVDSYSSLITGYLLLRRPPSLAINRSLDLLTRPRMEESQSKPVQRMTRS